MRGKVGVLGADIVRVWGAREEEEERERVEDDDGLSWFRMAVLTELPFFSEGEIVYLRQCAESSQSLI